MLCKPDGNESKRKQIFCLDVNVLLSCLGKAASQRPLETQRKKCRDVWRLVELSLFKPSSVQICSAVKSLTNAVGIQLRRGCREIRSLAQVCVYTVLIWPHISHKHTRINAQSQIHRVDRGPGGRLIKFEKCQSIINGTDTNSESHNQRFLNQKTRNISIDVLRGQYTLYKGYLVFLKGHFYYYFQSFGHIWATISVFRSLKHHVESISEV